MTNNPQEEILKSGEYFKRIIEAVKDANKEKQDIDEVKFMESKEPIIK